MPDLQSRATITFGAITEPRFAGRVRAMAQLKTIP